MDKSWELSLARTLVRKGPKPHLSKNSKPGRRIPDTQMSSLCSFMQICLSFWLTPPWTTTTTFSAICSYFLHYFDYYLLLFFAIITIVATWEHHILSDEIPVPTESPGALQEILPGSARELLGVLMTGVGTPDTWRQLLSNTRADSDGRQSTTQIPQC